MFIIGVSLLVNGGCMPMVVMIMIFEDVFMISWKSRILFERVQSRCYVQKVSFRVY